MGPPRVRRLAAGTDSEAASAAKEGRIRVADSEAVRRSAEDEVLGPPAKSEGMPPVGDAKGERNLLIARLSTRRTSFKGDWEIAAEFHGQGKPYLAKAEQ